MGMSTQTLTFWSRLRAGLNTMRSATLIGRFIQRRVATALLERRLYNLARLIDEEPQIHRTANAGIAQQRRIVALQRARNFLHVLQLGLDRIRRKRRCGFNVLGRHSGDFAGVRTTSHTFTR